MRTPLGGWGQLQTEVCEVSTWSPDTIGSRLKTLIPRGLGRAYGDSAINPNLTMLMTEFDAIEHFDPVSGVVITQSGCSLKTLLDRVLPSGWFVEVTPGTQYVTVGGMVAADVHGKNHHHVGTFASCVDWIDVMGSDGAISRVSRENDPDLFWWTLGGFGLTGIILRLQFRLMAVDSSWMLQSTVRTNHLSETIELFESKGHEPYSVAWIDSSAKGAYIGRSVVLFGRHAGSDEVSEQRRLQSDMSIAKGRTVPRMPVSVVNRVSIEIFNRLYYQSQRDASRCVPLRRYFYPLDGLSHWYRLYGPKGFAQYQVLIPPKYAAEGVRSLLELLHKQGMASPLTVLKKMGGESGGFSFPKAGYTLTFDIPYTDRLSQVMDRLIECAIDFGGRFYLAKDAFLTAAQLERSDPRVFRFREFRESRGLRQVFRSVQSERLDL